MKYKIVFVIVLCMSFVCFCLCKLILVDNGQKITHIKKIYAKLISKEEAEQLITMINNGCFSKNSSFLGLTATIEKNSSEMILTIRWGGLRKRKIFKDVADIDMVWRPNYKGFVYVITRERNDEDVMEYHYLEISKKLKMLDINDKLIMTKNFDCNIDVNWTKSGKYCAIPSFAGISIFDLDNEKRWVVDSLEIRDSKKMILIKGQSSPKSIGLAWVLNDEFLCFVLNDFYLPDYSKNLCYGKIDVDQFGLNQK